MVQQGKKHDSMKLVNLFSKPLEAKIVFRAPALHNIYWSDAF